MALPLDAVALVLLAALVHAIWNAMIKSSGDRLSTLAVVIGVGSVGSLPLLPFLEPPAVASWPYLFASFTLHVGYFFFLLQAYRVGDLSHVYPVARGAAPLMVAAGGAVFAGELLSPMALAGLVLASLALASFAFEDGLDMLRNPKPFVFAVVTASFISTYSVTDALGVRLSGSPFGFIAWLFAITGVPLLAYARIVRPGTLSRYLRDNWKVGLAGGLFSASGYALVIWAYNLGAMAFVSALRETSVVFAVFIGWMVLGEPLGLRRLAGAALVVTGIAVMHLAG